MATAQFFQITLDTESIGGGWKLYHYTPGTTTLKNMWLDQGQLATAAQPIVADANGVITAYADGLYDIAVYDANNSLKYTWPNVYFSDFGDPFAALEVTGLITATGGQIKFPGTQIPSSNVNTLDDYEEGSWTPVLTAATPGNLAVSYSNQVGRYIKIGKKVTAWFYITTGSYSHTTASGAAQITGLPFAANATVPSVSGSMNFGGVTKASYTQFNPTLATGASLLTIGASGTGQVFATLAITEIPSGGTVALNGSITYEAAN